MKIKEYLSIKQNRSALIVILSVLLLFVLPVLLVNPILNGIVKPKLLKKINSSGSIKLDAGRISYSLLTGKIYFRDIRLNNFVNPGEKNDSVAIYIKSAGAGVNWLHMMLSDGYKVSDIDIDSVTIRRFINSAAPDTGKRQNNNNIFSSIDSLEKQIGFFKAGNISVTGGYYTAENKVYGVVDSISGFSFDLDDVMLDSTGDNERQLKIADGLDLSINKLSVYFPESRYRLRFSNLALSSDEQLFNVKDLSYRPYMNDDGFFKGRTYRQDRFITEIKTLELNGIDLGKFIKDNTVAAGELIMNNFLLDALTNMRLPEDPAAPPPLMPNDALAQLPFKIDIKKAELKRGTIYVKEIYPYDEKPAVLLFSDLFTTISPVKNNQDAHLDVITKLTGSGELKVKFTLGLTPGYTKFSYSGELGNMNAPDLNKFISVADRVQVQSGVINNVTFNVSAVGDSAWAKATPLYSGLKINELDEETGKSTDLISRFNTFMANTFVIKSDNNSHADDIEKSSVVYVRQKGDAFMEYVWKALRKAIGEVVGFS